LTGTSPELRAAVTAARKATDEFVAWLEKLAPTKTGPSGVGKENYTWYQQNVHFVPYNWDEEVVLLRRELERAQAALRLEEHHNRNLPPLEPAADAAAFNKMTHDRLDKFVDFLIKQEIIPDKAYIKPALAEELGQFVPEDQRVFFSRVTHREPMLLLSHDYHWIDLGRMRDEPNPSPIRRQPLLSNIWDNRAEGFATAFEELRMHVGLYQPIMSASVPGARIDVRQLQYAAIDFPIDILIANNADVSAAQSAEDIRTLRRLAGQLEDIFRSLPNTAGTRNDWDTESSGVKLSIDSDRANLAGITNQDVAASSTSAMSGAQLTTLQEGNKEIPVVARLKMDERAQLSDIQNLYVYAMQGSAKIPLTQVSKIEHSMQTERIIRLDHFRTIAVRCFPRRGVLSSEVLKAAGPKLKEFEKNLPPGYKIRMGGDYYQQHRGFGELGMVMAASIFLIFLALVFQFNNAVKPFLVFAAAPYGVVGAVAALWIMGTPFGFMAFLGVASLIGVIVSHVIVLFDFIEEKHEEGEPFEEAVIDAGIIRLRPVMITVGATVLALFPLALHGGPLWQPLCYTQIGGLAVATFITLLLVPVLYAIFVMDLKILKWETKEKGPLSGVAEVTDIREHTAATA
jgi:preprotein translocase subunit SecF